MTSTANRQRKVNMPSSIRKKFAAAICMLLIAAIMMISSTYAWFTLSTAPEVTGITTNVGANGNLEIALLNSTSFASTADDLEIKTNVGDSMEAAGKAVTESNETWGNLVDLSDLSYGLDNIILNPAALNLSIFSNENADNLTGSIIQGGLTSPLLAPNYGADGRVIDVQHATTVGRYDGSKFVEDLTHAGVRVVGVSAGVTIRISTYRSALAAVTSNISSAKSAAKASLLDNGQNLATIMVASYQDANYAITAEDKEAVDAVTDALSVSNGKIADAIRSAALAKYLSAEGVEDITDDNVTAKATAIAAASLDDLAALTSPVDISFLSASIAACKAAQAKIDSVNVQVGDNYSAIEDEFEKLLDRADVSVNDLPGSTLTKDALISSMVDSGFKLTLKMGNNSGIYADIAKMVGNYTASGLTVKVTYQGQDINIQDVVMSTVVDEPFVVVAASEGAAGGEPGAGGGAKAVDDTYGYMIDMGFRTNAANSSLLLQQEGKQRIYDDSEAALTKGEGTYVEFTTADRRLFTKDDVTALMSALRVVFITPNDANEAYEILAVAAPNLKTYINAQGTRVVERVDTELDELVTFTDSEEDNSTVVTAKLYLYDLEDITVTEIIAGKEYMTTLGGIKKSGTDADFTITSLDQNKGKKITALVYLDGDIVDNTMVANAATSMTGKVNFQFASSAELIPMENKAVKNSGTENGSTYQVPDNATKEQLNTAITNIKASNIYTLAADAAEPSAKQTALLNAVTEAEEVVAKTEPSDEEIQSAAVALMSAYVAAGGTQIAF